MCVYIYIYTDVIYIYIYTHNVAGFVACVSGATAGGPQPGHGDIVRMGLNWPIIRKDGWCYGVLVEQINVYAYAYVYVCVYVYVYVYVCTHIYIYIYTCITICVCVYIYIYTYKARRRELLSAGGPLVQLLVYHYLCK